MTYRPIKLLKRFHIERGKVNFVYHIYVITNVTGQINYLLVFKRCSLHRSQYPNNNVSS